MVARSLEQWFEHGGEPVPKLAEEAWLEIQIELQQPSLIEREGSAITVGPYYDRFKTLFP